MNQPLLQATLPILSSVLGNSTVAGLMTVVNLALNTVSSTTAAFNKNGQDGRYGSSFKNQGHGDYAGQQAYYGQEQGQGHHLQSMILSTLATVFSTLNSTFASLTHSQTPLTTYILVAVLSYIAFRIVYSFISWVVRSVINLVKVSIIITAVTTIIWFIINVTSSSSPRGAESGSGYGTGQQQHRHQDPISQFLHTVQDKFQAEYQRQQQYLQDPHVY
ncbi:hypothetical protein EDD11_007073 [Mortierella claussenii]|nr:hypothetical protein EDD11_007073 [Mortierella claussenii]